MKSSKFPEKYQDETEKATNLLKKEGCEAVFLFGSMVTGKTHQDSDIDIGIMGLPPKQFFRVHADLDKQLTVNVDLVDFDLYKDLYILLDSLGEVVRLG